MSTVTAIKSGGRSEVTSLEVAKKAAAIQSAILKTVKLKNVPPYFGPWPVVDSGSTAINHAIGGTPCRDGTGPKCFGYPRRRITEVYGMEHSGKTTLALEAVVACQKAGGLAVYLDFEHALDDTYAANIGVDFETRWLRFRPSTLEEGLKVLRLAIGFQADLIVVDSVAAMVPEVEMGKSVGKEAKIGAVAKMLSEWLPKIMNWLDPEKPPSNGGTALIFINQVRAVIDTSGGRGSAENTSGGKAAKFYYSLRLKTVRIRAENLERKDPVTGKAKRIPFGNHTIVKVVKNKIDGTTGQTADVFIRHGVGIDEHYSVIAGAVTNKIVKKSGGWYIFGEERYHGREKLRRALIKDEKTFNSLRDSLLKAIRHKGEVEVQDDDEIVADEDVEALFYDGEGSEELPEEVSVDDVEL